MKNQEQWAPSKYVYRRGKLVASRDANSVSVGSRLVADMVAAEYDAHLKKYARGRLLDLGCGEVPLFHAYRDHVSESICVDWGESFHETKHLDCECDITYDLPLQSRAFDTVILSDVLEHVPDPAHLFKEMSRVLAINGKLIMNVPFFYWIHEQPYDYYRYTEFALRRFAAESELKVLLLRRIGGAPEALTDILAKTTQQVPGIGRVLASVGQRVASMLLKTSVGRKISEATSEKFPLAYFLVAEKAG